MSAGSKTKRKGFSWAGIAALPAPFESDPEGDLKAFLCDPSSPGRSNRFDQHEVDRAWSLEWREIHSARELI